jgi:hypothetical protein
VRWLALWGLLAGSQSLALDVLEQDFSVEDGVYGLTLEVRLNAPIERLWAVLTNYERLSELNAAVVASEVTQAEDGRAEVLTEIRGCVLFFCNTVRRVEVMEEFAPVRIVALTDPVRSDLRQARSEWNLWPEDEATRLSLTVSMEPDFWVPRLLGRRALRRSLIGGTLQLLEAAEARAADPAFDVTAR